MFAGDESSHILAMISVVSQGNPVQLEWMAGVTMPKRRLVVSSCWFPLLTARELVRHGVDIFKIVVIGLMVEPHPPQTSRDIKRREILSFIVLLLDSTSVFVCCTSTLVVNLCPQRNIHCITNVANRLGLLVQVICVPSCCLILYQVLVPKSTTNAPVEPQAGLFVNQIQRSLNHAWYRWWNLQETLFVRLVVQVRKASGVPILYKFYIINYSILFPTNQHSSKFTPQITAASPDSITAGQYHQLHKSLKKAIRAIKPGVQPISAEKTCFENKTSFLIKQFRHSPQKKKDNTYIQL